jgi:glycosyltransferase involved in cell wall biosynthesis
MTSNVTAIMTAMTDGERPWTRTALKSILQQSVPPDRVVVLVESKNDWIESDIQTIDSALRDQCAVEVHRIPLARLGAVRNAGVQRADTKWVAFLDGDDVWRPKRIENQLAAARLHPHATFVAADFVFIDAEGRQVGFANGSTPTPSSWLVDRETMLRYPFDPEAVVGEDHFWLQMTRPHCKRIRVPQILVEYRIRLSSISSLHHGATRQRRLRERMARASRFNVVRIPLLLATYTRYRFYSGRGYSL